MSQPWCNDLMASLRWVCAGLGLRQAEAVAIQELHLDVGQGGGGGHVVDGEEGVGERGGSFYL